MRPLSLRTKLVFTLAAIVTIVSCPLVYFAYSDTVARSVAAAEDKFEKITQILEEDIGLSYLNGQTLVNEKVAIEKDDIIEMLNEIETAIGEGEFKDFHEILPRIPRPDRRPGGVCGHAGKDSVSAHRIIQNPRHLLRHNSEKASCSGLLSTAKSSSRFIRQPCFL